jgi:hypothetical protein
MGVVVTIGAILGPIIGHALDTPFGKGFKKGFMGALTGKGETKTPAEQAVTKAGKCQTTTVVTGENAEKDYDAGVRLDLDFVVCIMPAVGSSEPSCDDMAQAYVDTVHPTRRFMVIAKRLLGGDEILCQRTYTKAGDMITDHLVK